MSRCWWFSRTTVERCHGCRRQVDNSCVDGRYQAWSGSWSPSHCESEGWYYCWVVLNVLRACHDTHRAGHGKSEIADWHNVRKDLRHLEPWCKAKTDQTWGVRLFYTLDELDIWLARTFIGKSKAFRHLLLSVLWYATLVTYLLKRWKFNRQYCVFWMALSCILTPISS